MAFPPEFSSTATYENRYDLDEIDVFLEGDGRNPMFFSVSGLPDKLSFGKHYFNLSLLLLFFSIIGIEWKEERVYIGLSFLFNSYKNL